MVLNMADTQQRIRYLTPHLKGGIAVPASRQELYATLEMLEQMLPGFALTDQSDLARTHVVLLRQNQAHATPARRGADRAHIIVSQLGLQVRRSLFALLPCTPAPFGLHIKRVVFGGAQKQVQRIAAARIIAAMADGEVIRNAAIEQDIGDPMSADRMPERLNIELTVPMAVGTRLPFPAVIRATAINLRPKTINGFKREEWLVWKARIFAIIRVHDDLLRRCVTPGAAPTAPRLRHVNYSIGRA